MKSIKIYNMKTYQISMNTISKVVNDFLEKIINIERNQRGPK